VIDPTVARRPDGALVLEPLAPWYVAVLAELPALLHPDQPEAVKRRLYPDPSDDEEQKAEWKRLVAPELFALIASAREIVERDLGRIAPAAAGTWRLEIPAGHLAAWIGALHAARLTLGERHGLGEREMSGAVDELPPERRLARTKVRLLGMLEEALVYEAMPEEGGGEEEAG